MALTVHTARRNVRLVCLADPDVDGADGSHEWRERTSADGPSATVAVARWLTHAELAECGDLRTTAALLRATDFGVQAVEWPGGPADKTEALEALPYTSRVTLGSRIIGMSLAPADPFERPGFPPSSGSTTSGSRASGALTTDVPTNASGAAGTTSGATGPAVPGQR